MGRRTIDPLLREGSGTLHGRRGVEPNGLDLDVKPKEAV